MTISSNNVALSGQNCNVPVNRLPPFVECKWCAYHVECPEASLSVYSIHVCLVSCKVPIYPRPTLQTPSPTQTLVNSLHKLFFGDPPVAVCVGVCSVPLCQIYFASASASSPSPLLLLLFLFAQLRIL